MSLLADIPMFVGLSDARHFGRAAAALGIPASTLSRRIVALEKELGVALVNRSTRSFALTEAGRTLYERARKLIGDVNLIGEDLGQAASTVSGHIRIGLRPELAHILFIPVLRQFARTNPGISFEVIAIEGQPGRPKPSTSRLWSRIRSPCAILPRSRGVSADFHVCSSPQNSI